MCGSELVWVCGRVGLIRSRCAGLSRCGCAGVWVHDQLDISVATGNHSKAPSDLGENTRPEAKAAKLSKRGVTGFGGDLLSVAGKIKIGRTLGSSDKTKHYQ